MTVVRPPRCATWLLTHLASAAANEQLLGDLIEEYSVRRSAIWFWRQVIAAIGVSFVREVRDHPWIITRAVAIGGATFWILDYARSFVMTVVELLGFPHGYGERIVTAYRYLEGTRIPEMTVPVSMWGYLYQPLLAFLTAVVIACVTGWIVGRLHSRHRVAAALMVAAALGVHRVYLFVSAPAAPPDVLMIETWYSPGWVRFAFTVAPLAAVLLGGIGFGRTSGRTAPST